jgi:hypothetical protein
VFEKRQHAFLIVQNNDQDLPHNLSIFWMIAIKNEMPFSSCLISIEIMATICLSGGIRVKQLALP